MDDGRAAGQFARGAGGIVGSSESSPAKVRRVRPPPHAETSPGLTCFKSAFGSTREACARYVPVLGNAAAEIARDLSRLNGNRLT